MTLISSNPAVPQTKDAAEAWVMEQSERGCAALVEVNTVEQARHILAFASTLEHVTKVRDLHQQAAIAASAMRVRAERRMGELLRDQPKAPPGPRSIAQGDRSPTLAEQGISLGESSAFQKLAAVDVETFDAAVEHEAERVNKDRGSGGVTRAGILRVIDRTIALCGYLARPSDKYWWTA